jgi:DNA-binding NarL/FixJ family response regulator
MAAGGEGRPVRVLVADDQRVVRDGLLLLLSLLPGIEVVGAAVDGEAAVSQALSHAPDVVLMDLHMPRLNGIEATEQIVRSSPHIGVLVLTMMEDEESVFAAIRAGARGYLLKGARRSEIMRSIEAVGAGEVIFGPAIAERVTTYFRGAQAPAAAELFPELTDRERHVLRLIALGHDNAEIARELHLSVKTIRNHSSNIFAKLHVAHRAQAIVVARDAGLE